MSGHSGGPGPSYGAVTLEALRIGGETQLDELALPGFLGWTPSYEMAAPEVLCHVGGIQLDVIAPSGFLGCGLPGWTPPKHSFGLCEGKGMAIVSTVSRVIWICVRRCSMGTCAMSFDDCGSYLRRQEQVAVGETKESQT